MRTKAIHQNKIAAPLLAVVSLVLLVGAGTTGDSLFKAGRGLLRGLSGLKAGTVEVAGHKLGYLQREGEGQTIVFLHGFGSEKDVWLRFLRKTPRHHRIIALDLPGHGDSSRHSEFVYDIPAMVDLVAQAVAKLTDEPVHVVGTSLGGMIATLYTAAADEKVRSLALYAPAGIYPPNPSEFQLALERGENPLIATDKQQFKALLEIVFHDPPLMVWPVGPALRRYAVSRAPFHQKVWNDLWPDHPTLDLALPQINVPVLLVWGKNDEVLDVSSSQVFGRLLADVETVLVDQAGHAIINEKPRRMARLHREFLERLTPKP